MLQAKYSISKNLLGAMVWSIETDDFHGSCPGSQRNFPLIKTIYETMIAEGTCPGKSWAKVQSGDSCYSIADGQCKCDLTAFYAANPLLNNGANCNTLQVGQILCCPIITLMTN